MHKLRMWTGGVAVAAAMALAAGCGGNTTASSGSSPSTSTCITSANPTTFVIMNNTVCPQTMTVARGTQVTMSNQDSRTHQMYSDPHPEHTDCPELNQIGFLNTGQSLQSGNLNTARICGFHDHGDPDNAALKGKITIQ